MSEDDTAIRTILRSYYITIFFIVVALLIIKNRSKRRNRIKIAETVEITEIAETKTET